MIQPDIQRCRRSSRRSEEHTSELQSPCNLVCRLLLEKKNGHNHDGASRGGLVDGLFPYHRRQFAVADVADIALDQQLAAHRVVTAQGQQTYAIALVMQLHVLGTLMLHLADAQGRFEIMQDRVGTAMRITGVAHAYEVHVRSYPSLTVLSAVIDFVFFFKEARDPQVLPSPPTPRSPD